MEIINIEESLKIKDHLEKMKELSRASKLKVSSVIVDSNNLEIITSGINNPSLAISGQRVPCEYVPKGLETSETCSYVVHAEEAALMNLLYYSNRIVPKDCYMFVSETPCINCTRMIVQSRIIKKLFITNLDEERLFGTGRHSETYQYNWTPYRLFTTAGIEIYVFNTKLKTYIKLGDMQQQTTSNSFIETAPKQPYPCVYANNPVPHITLYIYKVSDVEYIEYIIDSEANTRALNRFTLREPIENTDNIAFELHKQIVPYLHVVRDTVEYDSVREVFMTEKDENGGDLIESYERYGIEEYDDDEVDYKVSNKFIQFYTSNHHSEFKNLLKHDKIITWNDFRVIMNQVLGEPRLFNEFTTINFQQISF